MPTFNFRALIDTYFKNLEPKCCQCDFASATIERWWQHTQHWPRPCLWLVSGDLTGGHTCARGTGTGRNMIGPLHGLTDVTPQVPCRKGDNIVHSRAMGRSPALCLVVLWVIPHGSPFSLFFSLAFLFKERIKKTEKGRNNT